MIRSDLYSRQLKRSLVRILLIWFVSLSSFANDTLSVAWESWSPHQYAGKDGEPIGVNIDLIREICRRAGFQVEFQEIPWQRSLMELEKGKIDIIMSASKTAERSVYAYFSDSYFKLEFNVLFVKKSDKKKYQGIQSLSAIRGSDFRLGIQRGAVYSDEHAVLENDPEFLKNVQIVNTSKQNLDKLMLGRIDGFIEDELVGVELAREVGFEKNLDALFYLYGKDDASAYLMFSKKSMSRDQVDKLNSSLQKMKEDGEYRNILGKYRLLPDKSQN